MLWAFEQAVGVARIDGDLLRYLLAATAALIARAEDSSPRMIFEAYFRRSVSDDEWRDCYARLIRVVRGRALSERTAAPGVMTTIMRSSVSDQFSM